MSSEKTNLSPEVLEYQPDAVEIEERPVPGSIRWVLYVILVAILLVITGAVAFKVDRIVVAEGSLLTSSPIIVVQPLNTAIVRSIHVREGDIVEKDQILVTLDSTFASADLSQLNKKRMAFNIQIRRIRSELQEKIFSPLVEEGEDGRLQEQLFKQHKSIFTRTKESHDELIASIRSKLSLNMVQSVGLKKQQKLLRDMEGTTASIRKNGAEHRLRLLETQKNREQASHEIETLTARVDVLQHELKREQAEWKLFVEEHDGKLLEQEVQLRGELESIVEEINKAKRLHELISLRAPERSIVLDMAERSVGSIVQQAEAFFTLVPYDSDIEAEINVQGKDIARIRVGDQVRIKLDAFPFQKHDTLPGVVRVISEDSFQPGPGSAITQTDSASPGSQTFYRVRVRLLNTKLRSVPEGFRLMPGMKVRAEIKIGHRSVISYFLYPIIRVFDESLREP